MGSTWAILPAVVGPGTTEQPAKDDERWPASAKTPPPSCAARCTSAACRTGCPRHGCARSPTGGWPGSAPAPRGWRSRPPARVRPGSAGMAGRHSRRRGAPWAVAAVGRPPRWRPRSRPATRHRGGRRGWYRRQRDAARLDGHRALEPRLAPIDRAGPGSLAAAGRLGAAAIHRQVLQLQAEQSVMSGQHQQADLVGDAGADPLIPAAAQGGRRAGGVGDAAVAAAEYQHLDGLVEHHAVGDAGPVAARTGDGSDA